LQNINVLVGAGHNGLSCANYIARLDKEANFTKDISQSVFKKILISFQEDNQLNEILLEITVQI
jgi:hypothetical protein